MKKQVKKVAIISIVILLILGLLWMGESLFGNPISKHMSQNAAERHLETVYSGSDFVIEEVRYSFKDGGYYANVKSPSSEDSEFIITFDHWGNFRYDSYEEQVSHRENTARRVDKEYGQLVEKVLSQMKSYDSEGIQYGILELAGKDALDNEDCRPYSMVTEQLELNKDYNVAKLGAKCGTVVFYVDTHDITWKHAAQTMLEIRKLMDKEGVGFRGVDLVLREPINDDKSNEKEIHVESFPYEEIFKQGLEQRIKKANFSE